MPASKGGGARLVRGGGGCPPRKGGGGGCPPRKGSVSLLSLPTGRGLGGGR